MGEEAKLAELLVEIKQLAAERDAATRCMEQDSATIRVLRGALEDITSLKTAREEEIAIAEAALAYDTRAHLGAGVTEVAAGVHGVPAAVPMTTATGTASPGASGGGGAYVVCNKGTDPTWRCILSLGHEEACFPKHFHRATADVECPECDHPESEHPENACCVDDCECPRQPVTAPAPSSGEHPPAGTPAELEVLRLRGALEAITKVAAEANAEADSNEGDYYAGGTIGAGFADAVNALARAALDGGGDHG